MLEYGAYLIERDVFARGDLFSGLLFCLFVFIFVNGLHGVGEVSAGQVDVTLTASWSLVD